MYFNVHTELMKVDESTYSSALEAWECQSQIATLASETLPMNQMNQDLHLNE